MYADIEIEARGSAAACHRASILAWLSVLLLALAVNAEVVHNRGHIPVWIDRDVKQGMEFEVVRPALADHLKVERIGLIGAFGQIQAEVIRLVRDIHGAGGLTHSASGIH